MTDEDKNYHFNNDDQQLVINVELKELMQNDKIIFRDYIKLVSNVREDIPENMKNKLRDMKLFYLIPEKCMYSTIKKVITSNVRKIDKN